MVDKTIARASGRSVGERFRSARSHHAAQTSDRRPSFSTRQAAGEPRRADGLAIEVQMPREIVAEADKSSPPLQFPEQRVAAPYPLSALAGCRATAQASGATPRTAAGPAEDHP